MGNILRSNESDSSAAKLVGWGWPLGFEGRHVEGHSGVEGRLRAGFGSFDPVIFLIKKQPLRYISSIFIGFLFHKSIIICLPLYYIFKVQEVATRS